MVLAWTVIWRWNINILNIKKEYTLYNLIIIVV